MSYLEVPEDDAISLILSKYDPKELLNVIKGLKQILDRDPQQVKAMLTANQDLTYAILQAELLMGLVDESVVAEAMKSLNVPAAQSDVQSDTTTKPSPKPNPKPADPFEGMEPQQAATIKQVISKPEEQILLLPPDNQQQVRDLKKQYSV